jgi:YspA, cpYpsA-related SLOG family
MTDLLPSASTRRSNEHRDLEAISITLDGMRFRVLIAGGRHFNDYAILRATLDALLANRLPDVELLTTGGPGVPMLAASYATERGLPVTALVPDFGRFPAAAAVEKRDAELVELADAAVIVWAEDDPTTRKLRAMIEAKGIPVHVVGEAPKPKAKKVADPEENPRRGLPD